MRFTLKSIVSTAAVLMISAGCRKSGTQGASCEPTNPTAVFMAAKNGKKGLINGKGQWILQPRYESIGVPDEGRISFKEGGKYGYVDERGQVVIPARFDDADSFSEGLAAVEVGGAKGYIDVDGKMIMEPGASLGWGAFSGGLAQATDKRIDKCGYIDRTGTMAIPAQFDLCQQFAEGMAAVEVAGRTKIIDSTGTPLPQTFKGAGFFKGGITHATTEGGCNWIKKDGSVGIGGSFHGCGDFSEGLARVVVNGKVGFVDMDAKLVVPASFDEGHDFSEGLAAIKVKGKLGYIDKSGELIIPTQFKSAADFKNGLAQVSSPEKGLGYVNKCGTVMWTNEL